ncbi:MAG: putative polysaccharide biosynthesis protein, partial [Bacteroidetes bacterium]|nr:putative polysaccharide biosynthesis protein [Bacteroidota bacterium]
MIKDLQATIREGFQGLLGSLVDSQRGIRDVLVLIIPQVTSVLAATLTSVLLARGLGPTGVGKYALILSVSGVAVTLTDLGIGQTAIRFASRAVSMGDTAAQMAVLRWAFRLRLLFSVAVTGLLFLLAPDLSLLLNSPDLSPLMRIGLIGGIFTALASIPSIYFQSMKQFGRSAAITVVQTIIALLGIALVAMLQLWSVENVVLVGVFASAVGALIFLLSIPRHALVGRNPLPKSVREGFRKIWRNPLSGESAPPLQADDTPTTFARFNLASTLIVLVTLRLDVWLMGVFLEMSQVGIYNIATRFATPMAILLTAIGGALWPRASSQLSHKEIRALLVKTFRFCSILAVLGAVYAVFVPILAPLLFGKAFEGSTLLGQILCLRYAFAMLVAPVGVIGYSLGMVRIYWMINLVQLAVVVLINVLFLPLIGPIASALALLANELIGATLSGI